MTATDIYYILSDHLNTPRKITDDTGTVLWSWNSDAFGTTQANEDVDGDSTTFEFNLRFPGQYFDKESGEHYNYFRDYEPRTGRYLESDPIGLRGGINTFVYVVNNTLNYTDSLGLDFDPYCVFTNDCNLDDLPISKQIKTKCALKCENQLLSMCDWVGRGIGSACRRYLPLIWKGICYPGEGIGNLICEKVLYNACIKRECNDCEYEFSPSPFDNLYGSN